MGHAGAIIGGAEDTAEAKNKILAKNGISVVISPADIGRRMYELLH
jgi:succinyl-CoA synthetase alpha subunit